MPYVYLLLTRTKSMFSRLIHRYTGGKFTHASISLDSELSQMYSFGRLNKHFPLPAGFIQESIERGFFADNHSEPCALYSLYVSDSAYKKIAQKLSAMSEDQRRFKYSMLGIIAVVMGHPVSRPNKFFCSEFVADTLIQSGALSLNKHPALVRPSDFAEMPELSCVYEGNLGDCLRVS